MSAETPNDIDRAAIEEHAQRTVEQVALRKVRKALDTIEEAEVARQRTLRRLLIACAILAALGACLVLGSLGLGVLYRRWQAALDEVDRARRALRDEVEALRRAVSQGGDGGGAGGAKAPSRPDDILLRRAVHDVPHDVARR